jgi:Arc/MetJ-type ribon-helix-helix transcriptional regulator
MTVQIAVKLPDEIVRTLDQLVASGAFPNRSRAVRHALEAMVQDQERQRIDASFARGFADRPESPEELADATRLAIEAIKDEPWVPWW